MGDKKLLRNSSRLSFKLGLSQIGVVDADPTAYYLGT
jgi:hypothetical protein